MCTESDMEKDVQAAVSDLIEVVAKLQFVVAELERSLKAARRARD